MSDAGEKPKRGRLILPPAASIALFGGIMDPTYRNERNTPWQKFNRAKRGAWTRPKGGYKTKDQVKDDVDRSLRSLGGRRRRGDGGDGGDAAGERHPEPDEQDPEPDEHFDLNSNQGSDHEDGPHQDGAGGMGDGPHRDGAGGDDAGSRRGGGSEDDYGPGSNRGFDHGGRADRRAHRRDPGFQGGDFAAGHPGPHRPPPPGAHLENMMAAAARFPFNSGPQYGSYGSHGLGPYGHSYVGPGSNVYGGADPGSHGNPYNVTGDGYGHGGDSYTSFGGGSYLGVYNGFDGGTSGQP